MPGGVSDEALAEHEAALARHEPFKDFRIHRPGPDGALRCLAISGVPVFDEAGRFAGYRGVGRDLTELIAAEQRLDATRSAEHTSELQSLMRNSYAVFCLKKKKQKI